MEHRADSSSSFQVQFLPPASPPHPLPRRLVSNLCQRWLSLVRSFSDSIIHSAISALLWNWTIISHSFFLCVVTYLEDILTTKTQCWIHFLSLCEIHAQMFISLSVYLSSIYPSIYPFTVFTDIILCSPGCPPTGSEPEMTANTWSSSLFPPLLGL